MANTIAELLINIKANTAQLESALNRSEQRVNSLSKTASNAGSGMSRLNGEFQSIGRTAAAVALGMGGLSIGVTAVKTALEGTIQAAADDAASVARLKTAVENTGASYSTYAKQLDKVIANGQRLGFSDDQTRASLSLLSAQTGSVSEAMKRFAIAQDLSRGANIDLETSSKLLGKVNEENVRVLQRYGIVVKQGATETELFAAVQQKFNGQAETFAKSSAGQFERTKIAISEAGESVGRILLPSITAAATGIAGLADSGNALATSLEGLGGHTGIFKELVVAVGALAVAFASIEVAGFIGNLQQIIALQFALARGMSASAVATTLLGNALSNPLVAASALAAAFVAVDLAARHFTGGGLIDYLTGATEAHKRAAEAARLQGDALEQLAALQREGVTGDTAKDIATLTVIQKANEGAARATAQFEAAQKKLRDTAGQSISAHVGLGNAVDFQNREFEKAAQNVRDLQLDYSHLKAVIDKLPKGVADLLTEDLDTAKQAAEAAAGAINDVAEAIKAAKDAASGFSGAVSDLKAVFDGFDRGTDELRLQKAELEALKLRLGDAFSPAQQALLDGVTQRLALASANAEVFDAKVASIASSIRASFGANVAGATDAINNLTAALAKVPEEEHIKLAVILPDLVAIKSVWDRFIAALQQGASVTIAIRSAFIGANPPATPKRGRANAGLGFDADEPDVSQAVRDQINRELDAFNQASSTFVGDAGAITDSTKAAGGAAKEAASGVDRLTLALNASSDGVISLGEALSIGLTDAEVVALELAQAQNKVADAQFRQRIELQELAALFPGLNEQQIRFAIALQKIAENLQETGRTAEQFNLEERLRPALEKLASDFNALFNRPTRETAGLNLRRDELERKRLLLLREGKASDDPLVKSLDAQINAIQQEIDIRQKDIDIMRDKNVLADKTLLTDAALAQQAALLTAALAITSSQVQTTSGVVFLQLTNLGNAANEAADALRGIGVTHRAIGGPAGGLTAINEKGPELIRLPTGSYVFPAAETRGMLGSGTMTYNITTYITADSKASRESMQDLAQMVEDRVSSRLRLAGFASGAVNQNSFTPAGLR